MVNVNASCFVGIDTYAAPRVTANASCFVGIDTYAAPSIIVDATVRVGIDTTQAVQYVSSAARVGVDTTAVYRYTPQANTVVRVGVDTASVPNVTVPVTSRTEVGVTTRSARTESSGRRRVTAQLLDKDGVTVIPNALDQSFDRTFMDELNGLGVGSCSLPLSSPYVSEMQRGHFVRILVGGVIRFTFKIEGSPQYRQIDQGEHLEQFLTVQGRGWGCMWDEFVIKPEGGVAIGGGFDYSFRLFSFASPSFPNLEDGTWGPPQLLYEYLDGVAYGARVVGVVDPGADPDDEADDVLNLFPAPIAFPWPNAPKNGNGFEPTPDYVPTYWTLGYGGGETDIGFSFFRGIFGLGGYQEVKFTVTADNLFTLFLNGIPILGDEGDTLMWQGWKEITLVLPPGIHHVACVVENIDADIPFNPSGFLFAAIAMSVYPGDVETSETLALLTSAEEHWTSTWQLPDNWPGWSPGQILNQIAAEVQANGRMPQYQGGTYGTTVDSNGNTYDSVDSFTSTLFIPTFAVRLGSTGADALDQLFQEGWIDYHFHPDQLLLDIFTQGRAGEVPGVDFAEGVDITGLERGETKPYANAMFIQYAGGFTEWEDTVESAMYGSVVDDVLQTDAATIEQAETLGRVEIQRRIAEAQAAALISIEPRDVYHIPYEAFALGDYITIPDDDGFGTDSVQVLSITLEEDGEGWAKWRLECNARWRAPQAEMVGLLRTIGGKSMGSVADHGVVKD